MQWIVAGVKQGAVDQQHVVGFRMTVLSGELIATSRVCARPHPTRKCACSCFQQMTQEALERPVLGVRTRTGSAMQGKVFITRHGERADLADEEWLAQAEVRARPHLGLLDSVTQVHTTHLCPGCGRPSAYRTGCSAGSRTGFEAAGACSTLSSKQAL